MGMNDDLRAQVNKIIQEEWSVSEGKVVPEPEDLQLGNAGINLDATCLYADLAESTKLVDTKVPTFAAEVYKCYLDCACRIIRDQGGVITAFDGDRVMGIFIGESKNTSAVRSALAINHAVVEIINPAIRECYKESAGGFQVAHSVGVDTGPVMAARTGIRGSNDLVWVGSPANYAAKLCSLRSGNYASWITHRVYGNMAKSVKLTSDGTGSMWVPKTWESQSNLQVYASTYLWSLG